MTDANLHEQGFLILFKLMAGQPVDCPLCLSNCIRPTVTACVHGYCRDCIVHYIESATHELRSKCPVCRRGISLETLIEVEPTNASEKDESKLDMKMAGDVHLGEFHRKQTSLTFPPSYSSMPCSSVELSSSTLPSSTDARRVSVKSNVTLESDNDRVKDDIVTSTSDGAKNTQFIVPDLRMDTSSPTEVDLKMLSYSLSRDLCERDRHVRSAVYQTTCHNMICLYIYLYMILLCRVLCV